MNGFLSFPVWNFSSSLQLGEPLVHSGEVQPFFLLRPIKFVLQRNTFPLLCTSVSVVLLRLERT